MAQMKKNQLGIFGMIGASSEAGEPSDAAAKAWSQIVDPRLPLPWVIMVIVAASFVYFQLQALKETVLDLQTLVRAGANADASQSKDIELMKLRLQLLETATSDMQHARSTENGSPQRERRQ